MAYLFSQSGNYWEIAFWQIAVGSAQMMAGSIVSVVLMYSLTTGFSDKHVMLCTFGHFFLAQGILVHNYANSWSASLKHPHKVVVHGIMLGIGLALTAVGAISASSSVASKPHGLIGQVSTAFLLITLCIGPVAVFVGRVGKIIHASFGLPALVLNTISLCFGITSTDFKKWAGDTFTTIMVVYVVIYTTLIFIAAFVQLISRLVVFKRTSEDDDDDDEE